MKKSKHFRKDVIIARIIAAVLLVVLIALLVFVISLVKKPSDQDKNSQNTENTQIENVGNQDTEEIEDTQNQTSDDVNTEPDVNIDSDVTEKIYVKTTATLRLREEPNTSCATLERIPEGTAIEVLEELERWYKVIYNGKEGYVSKTYVEVVEAE